MSETITAGCIYNTKYDKPTSEDNGDLFGQLIETFMEKMAAHNHDGNTSNFIALNISKEKEVKLNGDTGWSNTVNGTRIITMVSPVSKAGNNYNTYYIGTSSTNDWEQFFPKITWTTDTQYTLETNIFNKDLLVYTI